MTREYDQIRREALHWVRRAGLIARERFGKTRTSHKADDSPVTDADHAVQAALLEAIARRYPRDAVVTEETQADPGRHAALAAAHRCWVIDPIDGTRNYARSVPMYCTSVAMLEGGLPVVGMVYDPAGDAMYSASAGGGMWWNSDRVSGETPGDAKDILVGVPAGQRSRMPAAVHTWLDRFKLRNTGSTAMHVVYLATGGFDAVFVTDCHHWDIAAGWVMANEVGVVARRLDGDPLFPVRWPDQAYEDISFLAARPEMLESLWAELQAEESPAVK